MRWIVLLIASIVVTGCQAVQQIQQVTTGISHAAAAIGITSSDDEAEEKRQEEQQPQTNFQAQLTPINTRFQVAEPTALVRQQPYPEATVVREIKSGEIFQGVGKHPSGWVVIAQHGHPIGFVLVSSLQEIEPSPQAAPPPAPPVVPTDTTPPVITIASHNTSRGMMVVENLSRVKVSGQAVDPSGIAEVKLNGEPTSLDADGNFTGDVFLKVGENDIEVTAMDTRENISRFNFVIARSPQAEPVRKIDVAPSGDFGRFYALIIGSNDYQHLPKLQTARNDAREMEAVLRESYGFETEVLLDATRLDILKSLNNFRKKLGPDDSFLMYYAGHGEFDKIAGKAYWLPVDAETDDDSNWIIVDSITSNVKRFASKHVLIVADSCYSGTLTRSALTHIASSEERDTYLQKMLRKDSRTLIASGGNEPVADSGGEGHSIFADAFLRALHTADQKVFTAEELFYGSIKESVAGRADQTPEYSVIRNSGHDGGDFLFVKN